MVRPGVPRHLNSWRCFKEDGKIDADMNPVPLKMFLYGNNVMSSRLMIFSLQKGHVPLPQLRRKGSSICVSEIYCSPSLTHKLINQGLWLPVEKGPLKWMFCGYILQIRKSFKDHCGKNEDVAVSENESVFFRIGGNTMIILTSNLRSFVVGTLQWCFHRFLCQQKTKQKNPKKHNPDLSFFSVSNRIKRCEEAEYLKLYKKPLGVCIKRRMMWF